jgi:hypothetical protein
MKIRHLLNEAAGVTAAFAFGRFNPAHQGHVAVWQTVQNAGVKWYIGTNPSTLGPNDPLTFEQKSAWMEEIYPAIAGHIAAEQSVVTLAAKIYKDLGNKEDATIAYITDDTDWAWSGKLLNQYNGVEGRHGYYKFAQIVHVPSPRVSSATALRDAARADDKVAFYHASGTDPKLKVAGKTYFDTVKEACEKFPLPVKRVKKTERVAEGLRWSDLPESISVNDKIAIFEEFYIKGNLTESNNDNTIESFNNLYQNIQLKKGKRYIVVPLMLINNQIISLDSPALATFIEQNSQGSKFKVKEAVVSYPPASLTDKSTTNTFVFETSSGYNEFRTMLKLKFNTDLPSVSLDEASLATMRSYFAGDNNAQDEMEITKQRKHYENEKRKEFRSPWEYEQWLKKRQQTLIGGAKTEDVQPGVQNVSTNKNLIPFPQGTTLVKVSDTYDWYKLGQVISDLDDADPNWFGQGAPETILAFGSEEEEHKILPLLQKLGLKLKDVDQPVSEAYRATDLFEYLRKIHKRWAIVSKREGRPLVYFKGEGKPSKEWVKKQERRIEYFKHKKK